MMTSHDYSTYNIVGPAQLVTETIEAFKTGGERIVTDTFPATRPDFRDVNIRIPVGREDEFVEWCEDKKLEATLV